MYTSQKLAFWVFVLTNAFALISRLRFQGDSFAQCTYNIESPFVRIICITFSNPTYYICQTYSVPNLILIWYSRSFGIHLVRIMYIHNLKNVTRSIDSRRSALDYFPIRHDLIVEIDNDTAHLNIWISASLRISVVVVVVKCEQTRMLIYLRWVEY